MSEVFDLDDRGARDFMQQAVKYGIRDDEIPPDLMDGTALAVPRGIVRGALNVDRAATLAGAVVPMAYDAVFNDNNEATDWYFKNTTQRFDDARDVMTVTSQDMGAAGQFIEGLTDMGTQLVAGGGNPSLLVASTQLNTGADLVREGVDTKTAQTVGAVDAVATGVGAWLPVFGKTVGGRVVGNAAANPLIGVVDRGVNNVVLDTNGYEQQAEKYDLFDKQSIAVDMAMGALFGRFMKPTGSVLDSVVGTKAADAWRFHQSLKPSQLDAIAVAAQQKHMVVDSAPGRPVDRSAMETHSYNMQEAVDALAKGRQAELRPLNEDQFTPREGDLTPAERETMAREAVDEVARENGEVVDGRQYDDEYTVIGSGESSAHIPREEGVLSNEERAVETRFAGKLAKDFDAVKAEYAKLKDTDGGRILNVDEMREVSDDYRASRDSRSAYAAAVHEPASWAIKKMYAEELAKMPEGGTVMFTSGGAGSGKSSAIDFVDAAAKDKADASIVYDTVMNGTESARGKIEQALAAGANVKIWHVLRDPVTALEDGVLPRAKRHGRTVTLKSHARGHVESAKTIQELAEIYKDDPRVSIRAIDNTGGIGEAKEENLAFVKGFDYSGLKERLQASLDKEYTNGRVSKKVYSAVRGEQGFIQRTDSAAADRVPDQEGSTERNPERFGGIYSATAKGSEPANVRQEVSQENSGLDKDRSSQEALSRTIKESDFDSGAPLINMRDNYRIAKTGDNKYSITSIKNGADFENNKSASFDDVKNFIQERRQTRISPETDPELRQLDAVLSERGDMLVPVESTVNPMTGEIETRTAPLSEVLAKMQEEKADAQSVSDSVIEAANCFLRG